MLFSWTTLCLDQGTVHEGALSVKVVEGPSWHIFMSLSNFAAHERIVRYTICTYRSWAARYGDVVSGGWSENATWVTAFR